MFKLVVLSALLAAVAAKPGYLGGHLGYSAVETYAVPAAVSSSYRQDVISKPLVATYAVPAPVITKTILAPAAVSSSYRKDVISKPIVAAYATYAAPVVHKTIVAPISYAAHVPNVHAW